MEYPECNAKTVTHCRRVRRRDGAKARDRQAANLVPVAGGVFDYAVRSDKVGVAQANLFTWRQAIVLGRRNLAEVILFDVNFAGEGDLAGACAGVFGVVGDFDEFALACGVVVDDELEWVQDSHGAALPYLNEILFRQVGDEESQVLRFLGGEGDLLNRVSAKSFALLERDANARQLTLRDLGAGPEYNFLFFNLNPSSAVPAPVAAKQTWFRDARFRRAISLSIDRAAMVRLVYGGRAPPLATHVTPGIRLWKNAAIPPPVRSVAEARKLLAGAGFRLGNDRILRDIAGRAVEFTILVSSSNQQRAQMASMIQQDLKELGIQAQVAPLESRTLLQRVLTSKNYEVCLFGLAFGDADPGSEMNVWPSSGPTHVWAPSQSTPGSGWESEIDSLMRQQMATQGYAARKKLYDRVQEIEAKETPIVSLLSPNVLVAARRRVGNFRPAVLDHYTLWNAEELFLQPAPGDKK